MPETTGRATASTLAKVVATTLVLLGLLAGLGVVLTARNAARLEADVRTREIAAGAVPNINVALRTALTAAESGGGADSEQVAFDRSETAGIPTTVAVRARDTGRALLVDDGRVVAATYSTKAPPESVAQRRSTVTGLHLVPLELGPTLARLRPTAGGISVTTPAGALAETGSAAPAGAATYSVPMAVSLASGWKVTAWTPTDGIGFLMWGLAALCVIAGLAAAAGVLRRERGVARANVRLRRLQEQSVVLAGLAEVSQRSLDLADVLPAVTTQLSDALGLRGLSLTSPTAAGERAFFRHGEPPAPRPGSALPDSVPAGGSASVLLARGTRTVARLNVLAGRDLDALDVATLEAAGEILTSSLTNAEAFAQQREVLQRLRAVDELKTVFLATASHELRTPVGVISGFAELLANYVDDLDHDRVRDYASRIDATAQQLAALVENLLDFSRMERGIGPTKDRVVLDLGATVRRVLDEHQDLAAHHEVLSTIGQDLRVLGTEHAVERVLTNLVGNAVKYSPAGTTVRVTVRPEGDRIALHVDDEGPGVAPADRAQVFSRFYRGSGDAVTNTRGAGLGLAIVHEFASSMEGVASVSEAPSGGARFTVLFPTAPVTGPTVDPAAPAGQVPAQGATDVLT